MSLSMNDLPESLEASVDGGALRLHITPAGLRSADESVGFVLLPMLMVLVVVSVTYLLSVMGLALSGHDPALRIGAWRPGFIGLGVLTWLGATLWYRRQMRQRPTDPVELTLASDGVTLREADGSVRWQAAMSEVARAEVRTRPERRLVLVLRKTEETGETRETREAPLTGLDADAMGWLAAAVNQAIGRLH